MPNQLVLKYLFEPLLKDKFCLQTNTVHASQSRICRNHNSLKDPFKRVIH